MCLVSARVLNVAVDLQRLRSSGFFNVLVEGLRLVDCVGLGQKNRACSLVVPEFGVPYDDNTMPKVPHITC